MITQPGKESQPAETFAEGKEKMEWVVEAGSYIYMLVITT